MKKLRITVDGKPYEVVVEMAGETLAAASAPAPVAAAPAPAPSPAAPAPAAAGGGETLTSPLAGSVVALHVEAGTKVAAGDKLVTLEAMKMNTFVQSPRAGTIASVAVRVGQAVEEGHVLLTFA